MAREPFWQRCQRLWHEGVALRSDATKSTKSTKSLQCKSGIILGSSWDRPALLRIVAQRAQFSDLDATCYELKENEAMTGDDCEAMNFP